MIPDLSVLWVIFFVLLVTIVLNQLLFKPLARVMSARETAVRSARELATSAAGQAQSAAEEFDRRTRAARGEVYQEMEATRRAAEAERAQLLAGARREAETATAEATARVSAEAAEARTTIERDADRLATAIAERVLGRQTT